MRELLNIRCDAVGNRDAGQGGAVSECVIFYRRDTVGNRDAGQGGAACECRRPY